MPFGVAAVPVWTVSSRPGRRVECPCGLEQAAVERLVGAAPERVGPVEGVQHRGAVADLRPVPAVAVAVGVDHGAVVVHRAQPGLRVVAQGSRVARRQHPRDDDVRRHAGRLAVARPVRVRLSEGAVRARRQFARGVGGVPRPRVGHQRRAARVAVAPLRRPVERVVRVLRLLRFGVRAQRETRQRVVVEAPRAERGVREAGAVAEFVVGHARHLRAVDGHPVGIPVRVVGVRRGHGIRAVVAVHGLHDPAQHVELRPLPQRRGRVEGLFGDVHRRLARRAAPVRLHGAASRPADDLLREERVVRVARAGVGPRTRRRRLRGEVRHRDVLRPAERIVLAELPPPALRRVQRLRLGHDLAAEDVQVRHPRRRGLRRAVRVRHGDLDRLLGVRDVGAGRDVAAFVRRRGHGAVRRGLAHRPPERVVRGAREAAVRVGALFRLAEPQVVEEARRLAERVRHRGRVAVLRMGPVGRGPRHDPVAAHRLPGHVAVRVERPVRGERQRRMVRQPRRHVDDAAPRVVRVGGVDGLGGFPGRRVRHGPARRLADGPLGRRGRVGVVLDGGHGLLDGADRAVANVAPDGRRERQRRNAAAGRVRARALRHELARLDEGVDRLRAAHRRVRLVDPPRRAGQIGVLHAAGVHAQRPVRVLRTPVDPRVAAVGVVQGQRGRHVALVRPVHAQLRVAVGLRLDILDAHLVEPDVAAPRGAQPRGALVSVAELARLATAVVPLHRRHHHLRDRLRPRPGRHRAERGFRVVQTVGLARYRLVRECRVGAPAVGDLRHSDPELGGRVGDRRPLNRERLQARVERASLRVPALLDALQPRVVAHVVRVQPVFADRVPVEPHLDRVEDRVAPHPAQGQCAGHSRIEVAAGPVAEDDLGVVVRHRRGVQRPVRVVDLVGHGQLVSERVLHSVQTPAVVRVRREEPRRQVVRAGRPAAPGAHPAAGLAEGAGPPVRPARLEPGFVDRPLLHDLEVGLHVGAVLGVRCPVVAVRRHQGETVQAEPVRRVQRQRAAHAAAAPVQEGYARQPWPSESSMVWSSEIAVCRAES